MLSSAVSMAKVYTKIIVDRLGIDQAKFVHVRESDFKDDDLTDAMDRVEAALSYPVFVKPSCAGSSKGVSKARDRKELREALYEAIKHDRNILVEETIIGREIECAVLGDRSEAEATCVGEILAAADFYDFDAKYNNQESKTVIDPDMPQEIKEQIRKDALEIFHAVDGFGCARVDFFLEESGRVVFNEINTMPGFTSISMYPMLWKACGIDTPQLIDRLLDLAMTRYR